MTAFNSANLHTDAENIRTSASYGDPGDGTNNWFNHNRVLNGGDVAQGATTNAAVTDPTLAGTIVGLLKGLLTFLRVSAAGVGKAEDAVHVTGDTGVQLLGVRNDARTTLTSATGDYSPVATGPAGGIFSNIAPENSVAWALSRVASVALANSLIVKASAGKLYTVHIQNGATAQFFQISNTATVPADATIPIHVIRLAANEFREIDFTSFGNYFATGITVCNSTTLATKTIGAADSWITALFL